MSKVDKIVLAVDLRMKGLDVAVKILKNYATQTMYNTPKDEIALVLIGSEHTDISMLTGQTDNMENISVVRDIIRGDTKLVNSILSLEGNKSVRTDIMSGLEVAVRLLHQDAAIKVARQIPQRKLMLFTDGDCEISSNYDRCESLVSELNAIKVVFKLIGPTLYDDANTQSQLQGTSHTTSVLAKLCNEISDAENLNLNDALSCLSTFKKKAVRVMASWKGCLEIGSNLKLPLFSYIKLKKEAKPSFQCCTKDKVPVVRDRTFHLQDENKSEVNEEHINKGYRYGKTFIPISKIDEGLMKLKTEKCMKIICTTKLSNIKKEELVHDIVHCLAAPPADAVAGKALGAFAAALKESDSVAIVRFVRTDNAKVVLGCLLPHVKDHYSALLLLPLPYSSDMKSAHFPRIKANVTEQQKTAIDSLIDTMNLSEIKGDALKPSQTFNPAIQRRFDCIVERAINPNKPLAPPTLSNYLSIPALDNTKALEQCIAAFTLSYNYEKNKKRKTADDMFSETLPQGEVKRLKKEDISLDNLLGTTEKVSSTSPVHNFSNLLKTLGAEQACTQLTKVILQSVQYNVAHDIILECLTTLRSTCVSANTLPLVTLFNTFLSEGLANGVIKEICTSNKLSTIHSGESIVSTVSKAESECLLESHQLVEDMLDDDDELLAMM